MQETEFHKQADATLAMIMEWLEEADAKGALDVEQSPHGLTISLPSSKQYVVSKHVPTGQLWLSSPISGGLHFTFDAAAEKWVLADKRSLDEILTTELHAFL